MQLDGKRARLADHSELQHLRDPTDDHGKRPRDIIKSMIRKYVRFVEGGDGYSLCSQLFLHSCDLDTLVRLDVRAQRDAEVVRSLGHPFQVGFQAVEV